MAPVPAEGTEAELFLELRRTLDGAVIVALGLELIVTLLLAVAAQPVALVTVTPSATVPLAPAVKVTDLVLPPAVIVPFVIVQAYVAPAPASATDAALPVEPAHTADGAVIVATG